MYSPEHYHSIGNQNTYSTCLQALWMRFFLQFGFEAGLLVQLNLSEKSLRVVSSCKIPSEPFNGTEQVYLKELIADCFTKYPQPHIHAAAHLHIKKVVEHLAPSVKSVARVTFIPAGVYGRHFVLLAFPCANDGPKTVTPEMLEAVDLLLCAVNFFSESQESTKRLEVTELFVKEVGHDIASCVQAIIAKLRTIRDGRLKDEQALKRKVVEIENEINNAYGISDILGLAVDRNYQLRSYVDFNVRRVIEQAVVQLSAEAKERNIKFDLGGVTDNLRLWGDDRAIQQCLVQLFLNAIKYGLGGSAIKSSAVSKADAITINVSSRGIPLPTGDDQQRIWDFGYRGKKAKEMHVNGSGIGLFTVRKIVLAHHGRIWADGNGENSTFSFEIPKIDRLKAKLGLLV